MSRKALTAVVLAAVMALAAAGCVRRGGDAAAPADEAVGSAFGELAQLELATTGGSPRAEGGAAGEDGAGEEIPAHLAGTNPPPPENPRPVEGGTLVGVMGSEPETLNPLTSTDAYSSRILSYVTDSLVGRNRDTLEWEPELAESWEISEDRLSYIFHLRRDVKWHDGTPFIAADVMYSYEKMMDPTVSAPHLRNYYADLDTLEQIDDYTVKFTWKEPYFLSFEFSSGLPIFPKHVFDNGENFNTHSAGRRPVGNGMFRFAGWKTNQEIVLERNEDYYGRKPHIKRLIFRIVGDENIALMLASSGQVDYLGISAEQWVREAGKPVFQENFNKYHYYSQYYNYVGWNAQRPYFSDPKVRTALTLMINREGVRRHLLHSLAVTVSGPFYIYADATDPAVEPWPYDPKLARRLLDEAGWIDTDGDGIRDKVIDGERVKFSFTYTFPSGRAVPELIGVLMQEEMRKAGIEVNLQQLEWAVFIQRLTQKQFDAVTLGWSFGVEQDPFQVWHSSMSEGEGSNFVSFRSSEGDRLIEAARREFDKEKRTEIYRQFHRLLHREQPYTFMFCNSNLLIVNKRVHNVIIHKLGTDIRDWYIPTEHQ